MKASSEDIAELVKQTYFALVNNPTRLYKEFNINLDGSRSMLETCRIIIKTILKPLGLSPVSIRDKVYIFSRVLLRALAENITNSNDWDNSVEEDGGLYKYGRNYKVCKKRKLIEKFSKKNKIRCEEIQATQLIKSLNKISKKSY